ncbi:MAG: hypothetical protein KF859_05920 [Phycisphaeraceae bacterium]|nr:hypothetical protein [Phycisphaeraceae bacterium]
MDERILREVLGDDARLVAVSNSDTTAVAIRRLIEAGATNILAIADHEQARTFAPVLHVARSLASFKRIVLLYDSESDVGVLFGHDGLLYLRDCPQVRRTLKDLISRDNASFFSLQSLPEPLSREATAL